jgi:AdoMet-dependent rRNA methyltransferase SPB1
VDKKDKSEISTPSSSTFADRSITDVDDDSKNKRRRLDPVLLALGEQMIYSSKSRRDLEDSAWNRYANNDDSLPDWFVDDEKKHYRKELPVTKEQIAEYRQRMKEINARPIKKVAEAQMRKRKREVSRLARAKKRATRIVDDPLLESGEKIREMKRYGIWDSYGSPQWCMFDSDQFTKFN